MNKLWNTTPNMIICLFVIMLTGCATKFSQARVDGLGYLPVDDDADVMVTVNEGIDTNQFKKVLYVQTEMHGFVNWNTYEDAVMNGLRELNFFEEVVTRKPTLYINTTPPMKTPTVYNEQTWYDMVQPAPYQVMSEQYGDHYLIAQATLRNQSADMGDKNAYYFDLKLIESKTHKVVFQCTKKGTTILGIDRAVINPVLNYTKGYLQHFDSTFVGGQPVGQTFSDALFSFTVKPPVVWE